MTEDERTPDTQAERLVYTETEERLFLHVDEYERLQQWNPVTVLARDLRFAIIARAEAARDALAAHTVPSCTNPICEGIPAVRAWLEGTQNTPSRDEVYELIVGLLKDAVMQYGPSVSEVEAEAYATSRFVHNGNLRDFLALFNAPQPAQPVTEKPK
jgi:hypothetical protein